MSDQIDKIAAEAADRIRDDYVTMNTSMAHQASVGHIKSACSKAYDAGYEIGELAPVSGSAPGPTDTDRIDALITLFGGHYAFPVMWEVSQLFQNGRDGLDAFLAANPSLTDGKAQNMRTQPPR